MKAVLTIEDLCLIEGGTGLSMELYPGDRFAVLGTAGSGKSYFLDVIEGIEKPVSGTVRRNGKVVAATNGGYGRRDTPHSIAKAAAKRASVGKISGVLSSLGLSEIQFKPFSALTPGQMVACDLIPCLVQEPDVIVMDGHLDVVDPWTLEGIFEILGDAEHAACSLIVSTCQATLARRLGAMIILRTRSPRFVGTPEELIEAARPTELLVETDDKSAIRAMVEPFTVSVKATENGLVMTSHEGQALAAKLLTQGYGHVKCVVLREVSLEEALLLVH